MNEQLQTQIVLLVAPRELSQTLRHLPPNRQKAFVDLLDKDAMESEALHDLLNTLQVLWITENESEETDRRPRPKAAETKVVYQVSPAMAQWTIAVEVSAEQLADAIRRLSAVRLKELLKSVSDVAHEVVMADVQHEMELMRAQRRAARSA
ncbi:MAG: hypothetical protein HY023_06380 [Chloroflexi bacterium]|nr:hypothetical protein [Chloroflexota bacterium]